MSVPEVRQATGEDLRAVIDIGHRTWPVTYGPIAGDDYVAMGLAKWWSQEATIPAIRQGRVTVAELDGSVVGVSTVGLNGDRWWIWKLYVLPEFQGRGVGAALMSAAIRRAAREKRDAVWLSYLQGNDNAASFYDRQGFTPVEIEPGGHGVPDSVVVRRPLTTQDDIEQDDNA